MINTLPDAPLAASGLVFHCQTAPGYVGVSLVSWCWRNTAASPSPADASDQEASSGERSEWCSSRISGHLNAVLCGLLFCLWRNRF